jgi:hypothetical protein
MVKFFLRPHPLTLSLFRRALHDVAGWRAVTLALQSVTGSVTAILSFSQWVGGECYAVTLVTLKTSPHAHAPAGAHTRGGIALQALQRNSAFFSFFFCFYFKWIERLEAVTLAVTLCYGGVTAFKNNKIWGF